MHVLKLKDVKCFDFFRNEGIEDIEEEAKDVRKIPGSSGEKIVQMVQLLKVGDITL